MEKPSGNVALDIVFPMGVPTRLDQYPCECTDAMSPRSFG